MNLLSVYWQGYGLRALASDGLMGLSPVKIGDERPDLFIDLAYEQGVLDEKVFSVSFQGDLDDSYITFGGYDVDEFAAEPITWHENVGEFFWAVNLDEVRMGDKETGKKYDAKNFSSPSAVIDSGSSYLLLPESHFWDFYDMILASSEDLYCEVDYWNTMYCLIDNEEQYNRLPNLSFTIDGKEYSVPRESLYTDLEETWLGSKLIAVEMTYIENWDEWLFGLTFLENYYAVYDMEEQRIGFAISKSGNLTPSAEVQPEIISMKEVVSSSTTTVSSSETWNSNNVSLYVAAPVLALGYVMYKKCFSNKQTEVNDGYIS